MAIPQILEPELEFGHRYPFPFACDLTDQTQDDLLLNFCCRNGSRKRCHLKCHSRAVQRLERRSHTDSVGFFPAKSQLMFQSLPVSAQRPQTCSSRNMPSGHCWAICSPHTPHLESDEVNRAAEEPWASPHQWQSYWNTSFLWLADNNPLADLAGRALTKNKRQKKHWRKAQCPWLNRERPDNNIFSDCIAVKYTSPTLPQSPPRYQSVFIKIVENLWVMSTQPHQQRCVCVLTPFSLLTPGELSRCTPMDFLLLLNVKLCHVC